MFQLPKEAREKVELFDYGPTMNQQIADWRKNIAQALVDNLNRNVLREAEEMKPGADWSEWTLDGRTLRLSPDQTQARELRADGWDYVVAEWVRSHATPGRPIRGKPRI